MWTAEDKQQVMCTCRFNHFNLPAQHQCLLAVFLSTFDSLQLQWAGLSTRGTSPLVLPNTDLRTSQVVLTGGLVVIHADPVQLQVAVSVVGSCWVDAVLIADHLPELNTQTHKHSEGAECWNDVILLWNINKSTYKYMQMCLTPNPFHYLHSVKI